jgi:hypothetical protein
MKVGIVAEGPADIAVIRNILKGKLGVARKDARAIRPELHEDTTDEAGVGYRAQMPEEFSNWTLVLDDCRARTKIESFLLAELGDVRFVVVHVDTAEAHLPGYDIARPDRQAPEYSDLLRALVVAKIDALLGPDLAASVRHAIAVEETDGWVLTIHDDKDDRDTGTRLDPKKRLRFVLDGKTPKGGSREKTREGARGRKKSEYEIYHELSSSFREGDRLEACAERNRSLRLFVDSLTQPLAGGDAR